MMRRLARAWGIGCGLWLWASSPAPAGPQEGKGPFGGSNAGSESQAKEARKAAPTAAKAELPAPTVKLLDAGKEPRFPLRVKVEKGLAEELVMTLRMGMSLELNGAALPPAPIPGQRMTMRTRVTGVAENGDITYEMVFTKIEIVEQDDVPAAQVELMQSMLQPIVGIKGTAVLSDRGIARRMDMEKKEGLHPQVAQMLEGMSSSFQSLSFPLPAEAVGTGARWEVKNEVEMQSIRLKQTAVYELALITGSLRKLKATLEQTADEQTISPPGLPPGAQVHLRSMASKGASEILLDLTRILPRTSKVDVDSDAQMTIKLGEQEQRMRQKMKMALELTGQESKVKEE